MHPEPECTSRTKVSALLKTVAVCHRLRTGAGEHGMRNTAFGMRSVSVLRRSRGFTLLELLVVMVIIGLLAGYVGPKYFAQIGKSEVKATRAQLDALAKALDQFRLDTGHYPSTEQGLVTLVERPANEPK